MNVIPNLTIRELGYLVALADHGHFGKAADACCVGQPTLSTQLSKLEKRLGITLFERNNKSVGITPVGQRILARARQILAEAEHIIELSRELADPLSGETRVGIIPTLSPYILSWLVPALAAAAPKLKLIIHEDLTDRLIDRLRNRELDAALLALPVDAPDLVTLPLFDEPFFAVVPTTNPLAQRSGVNPEELRDEHLLLLTEGHCLRAQALELCERADAIAERAAADFRATSLETLYEMVANGMGCTLMPALALAHKQASTAAVAVLPIDGAASRRVGLVYRTAYPRHEDLTRLADIIDENLPQAVRRVN